MKKKLMLSTLVTVALSIVLVTVIFILVVNYQYEQNLRQNLKSYNDIIINLINKSSKNDKISCLKAFKSSGIRVTYIDKNGKVYYDSEADMETLNNHNTREEVIEARKKGTGSSIRFSVSVKKKMLYYATLLKDGYVVRTSLPMTVVTGFEDEYLRQYVFFIVLVFLLAVFISSKVAEMLLKPIKNLQYTTSKIAEGELDRRTSIFTNDEIGQLGRTFNNMADKLQITINDALDARNSIHAILISMDSGVIAIDNNDKIMMINPYAKKIFGIDKDVIGKNFLDVIRNYELEKIVKENKEDYAEARILWPEERDLRIKTADIINRSRNMGRVAVVEDVTNIKKLENMRSQFVANVSHELKTPLTSIKGFAETLRYVDDPVNKKKFLDIIDDETERLTRLINDILTLSDIEQHKDIRTEKVDIESSVKDVYNLMKKAADSKDINLVVKSEGEFYFMGNADKFKQMLINLVDNAIKYSNSGARVCIGTKLKDNKCIIWVEDTGPGIPKEHLPRLFERFYRVDKARSRAKGGTGLGLAIVKHIVINFGGTIKVESEIEKGTKFIIELPSEM